MGKINLYPKRKYKKYSKKIRVKKGLGLRLGSNKGLTLTISSYCTPLLVDEF